MSRWAQSALVGAAITLAALAAYQPVRAPDRLRRADAATAEEDVVPAIRAIRARMETKRRVAGEVVAGRLSLLEAAAAFRRLDGEGPHCPSIRGAFPGAASDEEAYCLSVMGYAQKQGPPDQAEALARRLRDELDARLRDGALRLPE